MKYNLKNKPKCIDGECDGFEACKWFEGFEQEIRGKLEYYRNLEGYEIAVIILKEILGNYEF